MIHSKAQNFHCASRLIPLISLAHYQRSSDCKFFALSAPAQQRLGRPKKGRASKASRTSTQSILTSVSDGESIIETEINEASILAMPAAECEQSTDITKGKKLGKPRRQPTKTKAKALNTTLSESAKSSSHVEPGHEDFEVKVEKAPGRKDKSRKRKSDEMEDGDMYGSNQTIPDPDMNPLPSKRRTTRASTSIVPAEKTSNKALISGDGYDMEIDDVQKTASVPIPTIKKGSQKGTKRGRKGNSSAVRKASATSTAPRASSGDVIPSDNALEAALEADLDRPLTDNEAEVTQPEIVYPNMRRLTRTRPASRDGPPSLAVERRKTRLSSSPLRAESLKEQDSRSQFPLKIVVGISPSASGRTENVLQNGLPGDVSTGNSNDATIQPKKKQVKSKKPVKSRQVSRQSNEDAQPLIPSPAAELPSSNDRLVTLGHVSQVGEDDSGNETDVSVIMKSLVKGGGGKGKQGKNATLISPKPKKVMQRELENISSHPEPMFVATSMDPVKNATTIIPNHDSQMVSLNKDDVVELVDPSETISRSKSFLQPLESVQSIKGSESQNPTQSPIAVQPVDDTPHHSGSGRESTPSQGFPVIGNPAYVASLQTTPRPAASPQSSDAENQPPSSRPSSVRPPLLISSPPKPQITRIPLITTPTTSPSKRNLSRLQSTMPWSAIEYDKIFLGSPADKENNPFNTKRATNGDIVSLTSPEKKLSLQEWIQFNAKRGEEHLRSECERVIGKFEGEGVRALKTLEGIVCID